MPLLRRILARLVGQRPRPPEAGTGDREAAEIRSRLDELVGRIRGKVPADVLLRVEQIRGRILAILPRSLSTATGSPALPILRQTAARYLPEALDAYLRLDPVFALREPLRDGRTARELLVERLDLVLERLRSIELELDRHQARDLVRYGHFLDERFDPGDRFELDEPAFGERPESRRSVDGREGQPGA